MGRTKKMLKKDIIDSVKVQILNIICLYEKLTLKDLNRLKDTRTVEELKEMLYVRRLYSQPYGNPEGETCYYDDF